MATLPDHARIATCPQLASNSWHVTTREVTGAELGGR